MEFVEANLELLYIYIYIGDEGAGCKRGRLCNIYREAWVFCSMKCHVSRVMGIVGFVRGWFGHFKLLENADDKWLTTGGGGVLTW